MKKITAIIIGFVVVAFIVISTVGEKKVDYSEMNVVDVEFSSIEEDMYIPIEDWKYDGGSYTYKDENNHMYGIGDKLIPEGTEVIHLVSDN